MDNTTNYDVREVRMPLRGSDFMSIVTSAELNSQHRFVKSFQCLGVYNIRIKLAVRDDRQMLFKCEARIVVGHVDETVEGDTPEGRACTNL